MTSLHARSRLATVRTLFDALVVVVWVVVTTACAARQASPTAPGSSPPPGQRAGDQAPDAPGNANAERPAPAAGPDAVPDGDAPVALETIRIKALDPRAIDPEVVAYDARMLLDQGNQLLAAGAHARALEVYARLRDEFPDSRLVGAALYNRGLALEGLGRFEDAFETYRELVVLERSRDELERDAIDAQVRLAAVMAELRRWQGARGALEDLLARDDLSLTDRIEGNARLGYVLLEESDLAAAEAALGRAVDAYRKAPRVDDTEFAAMAHYYLAQVAHRQFLQLPLRLPEAQLRRDLEAKSRLATLAYDRYVQALGFPSPRWSTAAGYQMSQVYKELWDAVVAAPMPPQLEGQARVLYVREVHGRVFDLLEKALTGHTKNVELAEAYRTRTAWSEASRIRAREIAEVMAREAAGEMVSPDVDGDRLPTAQADTPYVPGPVPL